MVALAVECGSEFIGLGALAVPNGRQSVAVTR
jgi:hypothetical protein